MLFDARKRNGDVRPVQNPDAPRQIACDMLANVLIRKDPATIKFFEVGQFGPVDDFRGSQHAFSKDGICLVVEEIQRNLEIFGSLLPDPISEQRVALKIDHENFFPTVEHQVILDMLAGRASVDYPTRK